VRVCTATGLLAWLMRRAGFLGWTSFWHVVSFMPGHEGDERLLRHERRHLEQIERDGRLLFSIRYLWWLARHGYWNSPYEVEDGQLRTKEAPPALDSFNQALTRYDRDSAGGTYVVSGLGVQRLDDLGPGEQVYSGAG